jgi:hypothetical protein
MTSVWVWRRRGEGVWEHLLACCWAGLGSAPDLEVRAVGFGGRGGGQRFVGGGMP